MLSPAARERAAPFFTAVLGNPEDGSSLSLLRPVQLEDWVVEGRIGISWTDAEAENSGQLAEQEVDEARAAGREKVARLSRFR